MIGMPAFPTLLALLRDDDKDLRDDAASALSSIADPRDNRRDDETDEQAQARVQPPRDALLAALNDQDELIREGAARALKELGQDIVPELVGVLNNPSPVVRLQATRILGRIGNEASLAIGLLRERLNDTDVEVRQAAEAAVNSIHHPFP